MSGTHIQSCAMDNLMRLFFAFDNVRAALDASVPDQNLGVRDPSPAARSGIEPSTKTWSTVRCWLSVATMTTVSLGFPGIPISDFHLPIFNTCSLLS